MSRHGFEHFVDSYACSQGHKIEIQEDFQEQLGRQIVDVVHCETLILFKVWVTRRQKVQITGKVLNRGERKAWTAPKLPWSLQWV